MAKPSDIRHDPFMDVPTSITLTERHLIPSISPYTICLNEVPVKNSPTTTIVRVIDIGDGAVHYGADFDEVAATPIEGSFSPIIILVHMIVRGTQARYSFLPPTQAGRLR